MACSNCGSNEILNDSKRAETVCRKCGFIIEEAKVDFGPEWTFSEDEANQSRAGAPISFSRADMGVRTLIGSKSDIARLGKSKGRYLKLQKQDIRTAAKTERNLKYAFDDLKRFGSVMNLPRTVEEEAARLYRKALDKNLIRGRTVESVVAACIFMACKSFAIPKGFREVCEISKVHPKDFGKTYRFVSRKLGFKMAPTTAIDFIPRFASKMGLKPMTQAKAVEILKKAEKYEIDNGRGPHGLAAAAIYIAAQLTGAHVTQKMVADATEVTEVTIRNRYKEIADKLRIKKAIAA
jgi:transcription initiation factor TFIIB